MKKLGDPAIALTVVVCSIVLFLALAFALQGNPFDQPRRTLRAQFIDITGIQPSSQVKYAGAIAGRVRSIRMLTPEERNASTHPEDTVEVTIAINNNVPALNSGLTASVASDTLLSDKFLLLSGGNPQAPLLADGAEVPSITPVTFDALLRDLSSTLEQMHQLFGSGTASSLEGILPKVDALLADLNKTVSQAQGFISNGNTLIDNADGMVKNGDNLIGDASQLINSNKAAINRMVRDLSSAADTLDQLAKRTDKLIKDNSSTLTTTLVDARAAVRDLKAAAVTTRALVESLKARPQQLIWGPGRQANPR
jgi:phospholipid/cholesterol/gamma-HCH transport system substrate-binding protein